MTKEEETHSSCPHWSNRNQRCEMSSVNGLYIPLEAYAEKYCTSSGYVCCYQLNQPESPQRDDDKSILTIIQRLHASLQGSKS